MDGRRTLRATLVTASECHLCEHARRVVARLGDAWSVTLDEVAWESPEGQALVRRDGVPFPPAFYVEGRLVGYGRLSEGRLRYMLARQAEL